MHKTALYLKTKHNFLNTKNLKSVLKLNFKTQIQNKSQEKCHTKFSINIVTTWKAIT